MEYKSREECLIELKGYAIVILALMIAVLLRWMAT